jgi:hypothetical protein
MKKLIVIIFAASVLWTMNVPAASAGPQAWAWRWCGAGHGGAFNVRVYHITCAKAQYITENGLYPNARRTRKGSFRCQRHRSASGSLWVYTCLRHRGHQGLAFDTYWY